MRPNWDRRHPPACTCANCVSRRRGKPDRKLSNRRKRKMKKASRGTGVHRRDCPCGECATVRRLLEDTD